MVNTQNKKLTKKEKHEKAKVIIEEAKKKNKAEAVQYSDLEAKKLIRGKMVERIQRQNKYREALLSSQVMSTELRYLDEDIRSAVDFNEDGSLNKINVPKIMWNGVEQYTEILMKQYNLSLHIFKQKIMEVNYLEQALKNDDLTDEEIEKIANGTFVRPQELLDKTDKEIAELEKKEPDEVDSI